MNSFSNRYDWVNISVNDEHLYSYTIITSFEDFEKIRFSVLDSTNDISKILRYEDGIIKLEDDTLISGSIDDFMNLTYKFN